MHVKLNTSIWLLLLWSTVVSTQPPNDSNHEIEGEYFEGDMMLAKEQREWLTSSMLRNGLLTPNLHWPNRILLFRISSKFSASDAHLVRQAMLGIASRSCIRFVEAPQNARAYVNIVQPERGCSSYVGFRDQVQDLRLSQGCLKIGLIQHELLHALGFYHQQSDPNRDNYVKINYHNIQRGYEHNFNKYSPFTVNDFGVGYDYASVMHYGTHFFSSNGRPTIEPKRPNVVIGLRLGLTDSDFLKLNRMYRC